MFVTVVELLALAAAWGVLTWRAQVSGEMAAMFPMGTFKRRKRPLFFKTMIAFRWFQVASLVVVAALFGTGVFPLR